MALAHGFDPGRASAVVMSLIAEGHCPACPTEALVPEPLVLYGSARHVGRCPCCGAAWRATGDRWEALDLGRLVQG